MKTIADPEVLQGLTARLGSVTAESQRRWGTLTAHEMLCHLGDSAEMILKVRPREQPISVGERRVVKVVGLWTPFRWPHGWRTNPRLDPRQNGTRPSAFLTDQRRAIESLAEIAETRKDILEPVHGIFGRMSTHDWQRWAWKHTDHHLRQFGI